MDEIEFNEEGFMTNFEQWTKKVALEIASKEEVILEEKHWEVLRFLQEQHKNETALTIRRVGKSGVVSIKEFYALFPNAPLKTSTKIAGIPKPKSCI